MRGSKARPPILASSHDVELAALGNYTSSQFGFRPGKITPEQIHKQRGTEPGKPAS